MGLEINTEPDDVEEEAPCVVNEYRFLWRLLLLVFTVWALVNEHECFAFWAFVSAI